MMARLRALTGSLVVVGALGACGALGLVASAGVGRAVASSGARAGHSAPRAGHPAPRAALAGFRCRSTFDPAIRRVSVVSVMRPVAHTHTLSVRFTLLQKLSGAPVTTVSYGDLGRWLTPADPTLGRRPADVWKLVKPVIGVDAPARYRFRVQFRWLARDGHVLAQATRTTRWCAVRELRPDVLVRAVRVRPIAGQPTHDRYVAIIANRGRTASRPFSVLFDPGSSGASRTVTVRALRPGTHVRVSFTGPACDPAAQPTVVADPGDAVDDFDRANNTFTVSCPAGS
jgi:hypothetical protein